MAPEGVQGTLAILVAQGEAQAETIRILTDLCRTWGIPEASIAEAKRPLVMELGAAPEHEQGPGHTEPMQRDDVTEYHRDDPHPTLRLQTLSAMGEE